MKMNTEKNIAANDIQPFRPVHPGELLKDELQYRRLSQREVAKQVGLPYTAFNEILNGKRPVTTDFAMMMEAALGTSAGLLLRLQTDYNLQVAQKDSKLSKRLAEIRKLAAMFSLA
jgi:addiction module HigA family antidote